MLLLTTPTQVINLTISANSNVDVKADWTEIRSTGLTPNTIATTIANTNAATILNGPGDYLTQWQVSFLSVVNRDASNTQLIRLSMYDGSSSANLIPSANLPPGWALHYLDGQGFQIVDASGALAPDVYSAVTSSSANGAFLKANAAYQLANQGFVIGTQAFINANLAYGQANSSNAVAQTALSYVYLANAQAQAAYVAAQRAALVANSDAVFANGTIVQANTSNLNFNNTATTNVGITSNGTGQTNVALTVNAASILVGVVSGNTSNINITYNANGNTIIDTRVPPGGGGGAYQVDVLANGTLTIANANLNFNNTATVNVGITANGTTQANAAFTVNISQLAINTSPIVNPSWYSLLSGV